jgi:molybdopterin-biosynthesis enzyme MoeA-like protein
MSEAPHVEFGAIIIGDEILLGKRQDKHFPQLVKILAQRGLALSWCEYVGDDPARIVATLTRSFEGSDVVFSFGGIGATPDDHTRQCAAQALGVAIERHAEAVAEIEARFGAEAHPKRVLMADFPRGASIIPNAYNRVPGFSVAHHHFVPGFPVMAWPMVEWVLDTRYAQYFHPAPAVERAILVFGSSESALLDLMNDIVARYPRLKLFSLPSIGADGARRHIELGVKGNPDDAERAIGEIRNGVARLGGEWQDTGS